MVVESSRAVLLFGLADPETGAAGKIGSAFPRFVASVTSSVSRFVSIRMFIVVLYGFLEEFYRLVVLTLLFVCEPQALIDAGVFRIQL